MPVKLFSLFAAAASLVILTGVALPGMVYAGSYGQYSRGHASPQIGLQVQGRHGSIQFRAPVQRRHSLSRFQSFSGRRGSIIIQRRGLLPRSRLNSRSHGFARGYQRGLRDGYQRGLRHRGHVRQAPRAPGWGYGRSGQRW